MILKEFALLASDTARTKAYLQMMIQEDRIPGMCIVYSDEIEKMKESINSYKEEERDYKYFNTDIPLLYLLEKFQIPYIVVNDKDINSEQMLSCLKNISQYYLIYSGYGGYILKTPLFQIGKKIIHVHAGILPQYRGSTTVYYSYLQEKKLGATAIFLNEGIDEGEIITQDIFDISEDDINIDYIYEPYIRAQVLIKVLNQYIITGKLEGIEQSKENQETYYIIHPVLKHLALLSIEEERRRY